MYSNFQLVKKYFRYYLTAKNSKGHGMHSPFVFHFILDVLNNRQAWYPSKEIEKLHANLKSDHTLLSIEDLGAGSRIAKTKMRSIAQLAKTAVKPKKYSHLLFRLIKKFQPQTIVELGTSLGITTAYMADANPHATITTIEGSKAIQDIALQNFKKLQLKNIHSIHGAFDDILPDVLATIPKPDLAYIDGNHRYKPTIHYFKQFIAKTSNSSILIFDDIHWSAEMEQAWEEVKAHPQVRCTIDIFFLGFVFFSEEFKEKQHFIIRY